MASLQLLLSILVPLCVVDSLRINVPTCRPPDYPQFGYYGPDKQQYESGDTIHYFCSVDTYIGGNYLRICQDNGEWSGDAPVCDTPLTFVTVNQTSTADPSYANEADNARDGYRSTCTSTKAGPSQTWTATFEQRTHLLRVMLYLPRGDVNYEVTSIRADGAEFSCGRSNRRIERLEWVFHNCLEPNNTNIVAIRIRSLSNEPLQLCEVVTHGLTTPTCVDPHRQVLNGRLILSRKMATVVCNKNYERDRIYQIACIRTGVWEGMNLFCLDTDLEAERVSNTRDRVRNPAPSNEESNSDFDDDE